LAVLTWDGDDVSDDGADVGPDGGLELDVGLALGCELVQAVKPRASAPRAATPAMDLRSMWCSPIGSALQAVDERRTVRLAGKAAVVVRWLLMSGPPAQVVRDWSATGSRGTSLPPRDVG
jgi:hypothetical protein